MLGFGCRYVVELGAEEIRVARVEMVKGDDTVDMYPPGVMLAYYAAMTKHDEPYIGRPGAPEADEVYVDLTIEGNKYSVDLVLPPNTYAHDCTLMMVGEALADMLLTLWVDDLEEQETVGPLDRPTGWGGNREDIEA